MSSHGWKGDGMDTTKPQTVEVGDHITMYYGPSSVATVVEVGESCAGSGETGHWVCGTCGKPYANTVGMWSSACYENHRIAWLCYEHGPEVAW